MNHARSGKCMRRGYAFLGHGEATAGLPPCRCKEWYGTRVVTNGVPWYHRRIPLRTQHALQLQPRECARGAEGACRTQTVVMIHAMATRRAGAFPPVGPPIETSNAQHLKMSQQMPEKTIQSARNDDPKHQASARGRPVGDHEAKRERLLKAAAAVIAREGYAKASLRAVAQHIGQSTGAVTYYFPNKEKLIAALIEKVFDRFDSMLKSAQESNDIRVLLQSWLSLAEDEGDLWPVTAELFAYSRREPVFAEIIARRYERYRQARAMILKASQERGIIRNDIPAELLTDQLTAIGDGWMLLRPVEPQRFTPDRVRAMIDAVCVLVAPTQCAAS